MGVFRKVRTRWYYQGKQISAAEARRRQSQGEQVERRRERSGVWYIKYRRPDGQAVVEPAFSDKEASLELLKRRRQAAEREAIGLTHPADRHLLEEVETHLEDFQHELIARGRTRKHVKLTLRRIKAVLERARCKRLADIRPQAVRDALLALPVAIETRNHHLIACKAFTRWLWRQGRMAEDPLVGLGRWNAEPDRRVHRRALTQEELGRLIATTKNSPWTFRGLSGPDRAALYVAAAYTGLRVSELASLTRASLAFQGDPPTVTVSAAYSKHRRQDVIPIPPWVAEYLQQWLSKRQVLPGPGVPLWPGGWKGRAAFMLRQDLEAAGIPFLDQSGNRADFHALRAFYATQLARLGVNLQTAQALLRHSDPKLTAKTYTKLGIADLGGVVSSLAPPPTGQQAAENQG